MLEFDPEIIVMQAASTEPDTKMIESLIDDVLRMTHAGESAVRLGSAEQTLGWNFYIMSVDKTVARTLAQLPESGILDVRGSSLEQKFSAGSTGKRKQMALTARCTLTCCLTSSRLATDYFNSAIVNLGREPMDARVRKAMLDKIDETVSNVDEISEIRKSLGHIPVVSQDDFAFGIAIGRIYNSFHYQTRRALKRNATEAEFAEFLAILGERAGEIRKMLKQQ